MYAYIYSLPASSSGRKARALYLMVLAHGRQARAVAWLLCVCICLCVRVCAWQADIRRSQSSTIIRLHNCRLRCAAYKNTCIVVMKEKIIHIKLGPIATRRRGDSIQEILCCRSAFACRFSVLITSFAVLSCVVCKYYWVTYNLHV